MKHIFVGDVHGKVEQVERALDKEGRKIFVGDLMDSFDRSWADHAKCLDLVLSAVGAGEADVIYGNHELSYLQPHHKCSGWTEDRCLMMRQYRQQIETTFKPYILLSDRFLVSHAGLTEQIWKEKHLTFENLESTLQGWWPKTSSPMHWIGYYRGGFNSVGGMFWCDFRAEFRPIKGLTQVFGHTAGDSIRQLGDNFCIDCLDKKHDFLEMDL